MPLILIHLLPQRAYVWTDNLLLTLNNVLREKGGNLKKKDGLSSVLDTEKENNRNGSTVEEINRSFWRGERNKYCNNSDVK